MHSTLIATHPSNIFYQFCFRNNRKRWAKDTFDYLRTIIYIYEPSDFNLKCQHKLSNITGEQDFEWYANNNNNNKERKSEYDKIDDIWYSINKFRKYIDKHLKTIDKCKDPVIKFLKEKKRNHTILTQPR